MAASREAAAGTTEAAAIPPEPSTSAAVSGAEPSHPQTARTLTAARRLAAREKEFRYATTVDSHFSPSGQ